MTIKGMLIVGEFNYDGLDWEFDKAEGLIVKKNNLGGIVNFFKDGINAKFFVLPLMNELGIVINGVTDNINLSETYINSTNALFNNQYMRDNEIVSAINIESSQLKINFSINSIIDNKKVDTIDKLAKGYIDLLIFLFKNKFLTKNMIQFKNENGDGRTFQVEKMGLLIGNIEEYQNMITQYKGNFKDIIAECDKIIKNEIGNNKNNYNFIKRLALKEYDFVGNTFFTDATEKVEQTTLTNLDLVTFIDVTNEWYKSNLEKPDDINNNKIVISPVIDYSNCLYVDTKGNFIMNAKIVSINKVNGSANNSLDTYELTISPRTQGNFIPPATSIKKYQNTNTGETPNINDDKNKEKLGLTKTTFTQRI